MSALQEVNLKVSSGNQAFATDEAFLRQFIASVFWNWYYENLNRKVTAVSWWVFKKTFFVRDLRSIFELLFGEDPASSTHTP